MKRLVTWFIIGLCLLIISGCTAANEDTTALDDARTDELVTEAILGSWERTDVTPVDDEDTLEMITTLTFYDDDTYSETLTSFVDGKVSDEVEVEGTYEVNGYEIILTSEDADGVETELSLGVELDGDLMTVTPQGSTAFELTRVG